MALCATGSTAAGRRHGLRTVPTCGLLLAVPGGIPSLAPRFPRADDGREDGIDACPGFVSQRLLTWRAP